MANIRRYLVQTLEHLMHVFICFEVSRPSLPNSPHGKAKDLKDQDREATTRGK